MFLSKLRHNFLSFILILGGILITLPYIAAIGQFVESKTFPVLINQKVYDISRNENEVKFMVSVTKIRDCRSISISWVALQGSHIYAISVLNSSGAPALAKTYFNTGETITGPFTAVLPDVAKNAEYIKANIFYECHAGFETRQEFALIPLAR